MKKVFAVCLGVVALGLAYWGQAQAQTPPTPVYTVITVEKMHCNGCATKIANKIYEVPGVDKVQVDVAKKLLWVHPKTGTQPSPRGLWEAVEQAADRPVRLQGPYGDFTAKPKS